MKSKKEIQATVAIFETVQNKANSNVQKMHIAIN